MSIKCTVGVFVFGQFTQHEKKEISHRHLGKIPVGKGLSFLGKEVPQKLIALIEQPTIVLIEL